MDQIVSYKKVLTNKHSNFALLCCFMITFVATFNEGFLSEELGHKGMKLSATGYVNGGN